MTRIAAITGAASGIAAAVADRLAAAGRHLALIDNASDGLARKQAEILARHPHLRVVTCAIDARDSAMINDAFAKITAELGAPDILVNCVGGSSPQRPIETISDMSWDAAITLNLKPLFFSTRAAAPAMRAKRWGRIVNVSSVAGRTRSLFGGVDYAAAKHGVIGFTRQAAYELGPHGITVNVVAPGVTLSERVKQRWAEKDEENRAFIEGLIPVGRPATCDEPAAAIAFLCGEDASYVNGAVIDVNGGLYIGG